MASRLLSNTLQANAGLTKQVNKQQLEFYSNCNRQLSDIKYNCFN